MLAWLVHSDTNYRVKGYQVSDGRIGSSAIAGSPVLDTGADPPILWPSMAARGPSWCSGCGRPDADPLTGMLDRWQWTRSAVALVEALDDTAGPVALLLADIDRFKAINDSAGHAAGDIVLARVAEVIRSATRAGDLWGRYGSYTGDEFAGLLPGAGLPEAVIVAQRLQRKVAAMRISVATPLGTREISGLSISVGLATCTRGRSLDETVGRADMALLTAKRSGRNCVCVADVNDHPAIASRFGDEQSCVTHQGSS